MHVPKNTLFISFLNRIISYHITKAHPNPPPPLLLQALGEKPKNQNLPIPPKKNSPLLFSRPQQTLQQHHFRSIPAHLDPKTHIRLDPPIRPGKMPRRAPKLILRKIQIPIPCNRHTIRPPDPRIPHKYTHQARLRVENVNGVGFEIAGVDEAVAVGFQAVGDAFLAEGEDAGLGVEVGGRVVGVGAKEGGGDAVEGSGCDSGVVEGGAVGGEGDAVGA